MNNNNINKNNANKNASTINKIEEMINFETLFW